MQPTFNHLQLSTLLCPEYMTVWTALPAIYALCVPGSSIDKLLVPPNFSRAINVNNHHHYLTPRLQLLPLPTTVTMSDPRGGKRTSAESDEASRKKVKKEDEVEEKYNPYLAHMYEDERKPRNGFKEDEPALDSPLAGMKRRQTTAKQASKAEDSPSNPFTGRAHSQKYFQILQTRRELPVSKQRYAHTERNLSERVLTCHQAGVS